MIWADFIILGILLLSTFISLLRGFLKEALSLVGWILSLWVAYKFSYGFSALFLQAIPGETLRLLVAVMILFVLTLISTSVFNFFALRVIKLSVLTGADRFLGLVFGLLRGTLVVLSLVLLAGLSSLPTQPWWKESLFLGHFQMIALWVLDVFFSDLASNFSY